MKNRFYFVKLYMEIMNIRDIFNLSLRTQLDIYIRCVKFYDTIIIKEEVL